MRTNPAARDTDRVLLPRSLIKRPQMGTAEYDADPRYAYLEWLHTEARLLQRELFPEVDPRLKFSPCNTFASDFHFPPDGRDWTDVPPPSTRAELVLRAVGVVTAT